MYCAVTARFSSCSEILDVLFNDLFWSLQRFKLVIQVLPAHQRFIYGYKRGKAAAIADGFIIPVASYYRRVGINTAAGNLWLILGAYLLAVYHGWPVPVPGNLFQKRAVIQCLAIWR